MKKQLILLLVAAAAIGNLNAAAVRNAARTAFISGRQTFQSVLPKGVSNSAKQTSYLRTSVPQNIKVTQPMVQQFARPTYFSQFRNWFNNLFANRSRTALATGTAALGGGTIIKSWIDEQPIIPGVYAEEENDIWQHLHAQLWAKGSRSYNNFNELDNELANEVEKAIQNGVNVNLKGQDGKTPLLRVIAYAYVTGKIAEKTIKKLLHAGADINSKNTNDWTPFMLASGSGDTNLLQLLLDHGANINDISGDENALTIAISKNQDSTIEFLIEKGIDINAKDNEGNNIALMEATRKGKTNSLELLLKNGAKNENSNVSLQAIAQESLPQKWRYNDIIKILNRYNIK